MTSNIATSHTWDFATDETPRLILDAHYADVTVHHDGGPGQTTVTLTARKEIDVAAIEARSYGRDVQLVIPALAPAERENAGWASQLGNLLIGAVRGVGLTLDVHLPEGAELDLKVRGGDITVVGRSGNLRARTGGGDVRFGDAEQVTVHTGGGDIRASRATHGALDTGGGDISIGSLGEGRLTSGGGDVSVEALGSGAIRTGGGDIRVGRTEGDVTVATGAGDVHLDGCLGTTDVNTGAGDVRVHVTSGRLNVRSGLGDITVTVPEDVPVWQDLSSPLGDVSSRLGARGEPSEGQAHIVVAARTGTGDVTLS